MWASDASIIDDCAPKICGIPIPIEKALNL